MNTPNTQPIDTGLPAALVRSENEPGQKTIAQAATEAKTERKIKAPRAAKPKVEKVAKPRKGKVVEADHKPSEVVATEQNPQKSIVPVRFKARYAEHGDSNGDRVALALKAYVAGVNADGRPSTDVAKLREVAEANGIDFNAYARLNIGQQRMNVGNRLRGMLKNEKPVTIGKQRFADWEKAKIVAPAKPKAEKVKAEASAAA